jgi:uncharacterized protein (DUF2164 family)
MNDPLETKEELVERKFNEIIEAEIVSSIDNYTTRMKDILIALKMAGIQLDFITASAMHELSQRIGHAFTEAMEE